MSIRRTYPDRQNVREGSFGELLLELTKKTEPEDVQQVEISGGVGSPSATGTLSAVPDNAASVTILAANPDRLGASVFNDSTVTLYLKLGSGAATTTDYTVQLVAGAYYETPFGYTGAITGIWASDPGTGGARVTEFTA